MHRSLTLAAVTLLLAAPAGPAEDPVLRGFTPDSSAVERQWEGKLRDLPSADVLRETMRRLSARPHHVGSPYDKENAEWILARFKEWGMDARIETFGALFPTPKERLLEMVEPTRFVARLDEPALGIDPTSGQKAEQLPTYNAYSIDGDVTGPLVYVNYGLPEDYERLERLGVSVEGAIVIARYGNSWRGIKPKVAAEHGAVGCLIYSDPRDDGYFVDEVFPKGPMRPAPGVQRGSVMDFAASSPGDPLTPGVGATPEAKRLALKDAASLTKIPVLPISYGDAQPLLAALGGPLAPSDWRGALPITYHVGPGPAKAHLKLAFRWDVKDLYNVVGRIPGSERPDEWVLRGNHHDAWVNGAEDPVSGVNVLLEEARALGELLKQGWRPRRTIVYCAWDGEEPMLLGSTEWVEAHAARASPARRCVRQHRRQRPRLPEHGRLPHPRAPDERGRGGRPRPGDRPVGEGAPPAARSLPCERRRAQGAPRASRPPIGGARIGDGLHRVPRLHRGRLPEPRLRRRGRGWHLPLHLRRLLLVHSLLGHGTSPTAAPWPRWSEPP